MPSSSEDESHLSSSESDSVEIVEVKGKVVRHQEEVKQPSLNVL
jgi:hypothetical protein